MPHTVVFTYPDPSHVSSSLPVFAGLVRRGEQVTVYSAAARREPIEAAGATFRCYDGTMEASSTGPFGGMLRRLGFAEQILPGILDALRAERPDYVVFDAAAIWGLVVSGALAIPAVSYRATFALHRDMCGAAEIATRYYSQVSQASALQGMLDLAGYYELARRLDARYGSTTSDLAGSLECRSGLNLVFASRALQIEAERFDASYRFLGRCLEECPVPDAYRWEELGTEPLIYIALGTVFNNRPEFYRTCMEAFGGLPFRVVMPVGYRVDIAALGPSPANFLIVPMAPMSVAKLLERTVLAITHAGANTVEDCARGGTPQLMYPQAGDQFVIADLIQKIGAGVRLSDSDIQPVRLRELATQVMTGESFCKAAAALQEQVRTGGGTAQACAEILEFARACC